jgi:hypothetical protein
VQRAVVLMPAISGNQPSLSICQVLGQFLYASFAQSGFLRKHRGMFRVTLLQHILNYFPNGHTNAKAETLKLKNTMFRSRKLRIQSKGYSYSNTP